MKKESLLLRVDPIFKEHIVAVKAKVREISGKPCSDREVTLWISKLNQLPKIKEGIVLQIVQEKRRGNCYE